MKTKSEFDSKEEEDFNEWLKEAKQKNLISSFLYHPKQFLLSEAEFYISGISNKKLSLFRSHSYVPDFSLDLIVSKKTYSLINEFKISKDNLEKSKNPRVYIDVKGTWQRFGGDRSFAINRKWIWQKYKIYIVKLIPKNFFKKFGVPKKCQTNLRTGKLRKCYLNYKTLDQIFI